MLRTSECLTDAEFASRRHTAGYDAEATGLLYFKLKHMRMTGSKILPPAATVPYSAAAQPGAAMPSDAVPDRTYIYCRYPEGPEQAKPLGARWDADRKSWYVPPGMSLTAFARWRRW